MKSLQGKLDPPPKKWNIFKNQPDVPSNDGLTPLIPPLNTPEAEASQSIERVPGQARLHRSITLSLTKTNKNLPDAQYRGGGEAAFLLSLCLFVCFF